MAPVEALSTTAWIFGGCCTNVSSPGTPKVAENFRSTHLRTSSSQSVKTAREPLTFAPREHSSSGMESYRCRQSNHIRSIDHLCSIRADQPLHMADPIPSKCSFILSQTATGAAPAMVPQYCTVLRHQCPQQLRLQLPNFSANTYHHQKWR